MVVRLRTWSKTPRRGRSRASTVGPRAHRGTVQPKSGARRQASSHSRSRGRKATSATASVKTPRRTDGKSRPTRESSGHAGAGVEGRLQKSVRSIFPPREGVQSPGAGWVARRGGASRDRRCMPSSGERVRAWERDRKGSASGSHSIARSRIEPMEGVLERAVSALKQGRGGLSWRGGKRVCGLQRSRPAASTRDMEPSG